MVYTDIHLPLPAFIALDWTLMLLALIPILIHLHTHLHQPPSRAKTISSLFIILSWLSGMTLISINTWKNTLRMKYIYSPPSNLYYGVPTQLSAHLLYISWISLFTIYISLWSAKAAFLAFYYSIFSLQGKRARYGLAGACIFTAATFLLHMFLIAFWCTPISANWAPGPDRHLCSAVHSIKSVTISTFTNVATDLVILGIPISTLLSARLGGRERAGITFIFFIGGISILAALVRFVCLQLIQSIPRASITHTIDVWALVEIVASILAVCLPSLRVFVRGRRGVEGARALESQASEERDSRVSGSGSSLRVMEIQEADMQREEKSKEILAMGWGKGVDAERESDDWAENGHKRPQSWV